MSLRGGNLWRNFGSRRLMSTGGKSVENGLFNWNHPFFRSLNQFVATQKMDVVNDVEDKQLIKDYLDIIEKKKQRYYKVQLMSNEVRINTYLDFCIKYSGKRVYQLQNLYLDFAKANLTFGVLGLVPILMLNDPNLTFIYPLIFNIFHLCSPRINYIIRRHEMKSEVARAKLLEQIGGKIPRKD